MDFVTLGSDWLPEELIENHSSLIWTERFDKPGEFVISIPDITYGKALLPRGTFVSLLDTRHTMRVESHVVDNNGSAPVLKVSGRSVHAYLENREATGGPNNDTIVPATPKWLKTFGTMTDKERIEWLLYRNVNSGDDSYWLNVYLSEDITILEHNNTKDGSNRSNPIRRGATLLSEIEDTLSSSGNGLASLRPWGSGITNGYVITFTGTDGFTRTRTYNSTVTKLAFEVYGGVDRSDRNAPSSYIEFYTDNDEIENARFLETELDYYTHAFVYSDSSGSAWAQEIVTAPWSNATTFGFNRKILIVDASDITEEFVSMTGKTAAQLAQIRGRAELEKHKKTRFFEGNLTSATRYTYNTHYGLGDKVMLRGDLGFDAPMIVSEFVRTQDANGETGYPTLIVPS